MKEYKESSKKENTIFEEKELKAFPFSFNFAIFAEAIYFEEMERVIFENIPNSFTQEMLSLFKDTPFEIKVLYSSLVRTSDFLHDMNHPNGVKITNLLQKCIVDNVGLRDNEVISSNTLKLHYKQKSLKRSRSRGLLERIKEAKEMGADGERIQYKIYSFYTMFGMALIEEKKIDEFKFLKPLYTRDTRKLITKKAEALCFNLSDEVGFEISSIFMDIALDLDGIVDEIDSFRAYTETKKLYRASDAREYSLYKRKRRFFGLL